MKRATKAGLMFFAALGLIFAASLVLASAQYGYGYINLRQGAQDVIQWIVDIAEPFLSIILGEVSSELLFIKFLLFIVVFSVSFVVLKKFPLFSEKIGVVVIISIVVSILGARYIQESEIVKGMLIPYGAFFIIINCIIPFIIYFYFVLEVGKTAFLRRLLWTIFLVIFLGLWIVRSEEVNVLSNIYLITAVAALILVLFDKVIFRLWQEGKITKIIDSTKRNNAINAYARIKALEDNLSTTNDPNMRGMMLKELHKERLNLKHFLT